MLPQFVEQLLLTFYAVAPFFVIMGFGWLAVRTKLASDKFIAGLNKLVFTYFFPAALFLDIVRADLSYAFDLGLVLYFTLGTFAAFLLIWLISARFLSGAKLASFVQSGWRGSYIILALAVIPVLLGEAAMPKTALMVPFTVVVYNTLAAVLFILSGLSQDIPIRQQIKDVLRGILINPLMIGIFAGVLVNFSGLSLPLLLDRSIVSLGTMAAPAAMIGIGGVLSMEMLRRSLKLAVWATVVKNTIFPLLFLLPAILLGFRGVELAILAIVGLSPVGPISYATAVEMGGDGDVAASCLVLSNAVAVFTIVPGLAILQALGLF